MKWIWLSYEKASGDRKDALDDQLDVAKAQQELDQDEIDDATQDLIRAGGDPKGRIQTMVEEHEAASHAADSFHVVVTNAVEERGLIHRFQQWSVLHRKQLLLWQAKREAESAAAAFTAKHNALEARSSAKKASASRPEQPAKSGPEAARGAPMAKLSREESAALVQATKRRSAEAKELASLDKRIDDQKQLAETYGNWIEAIAAKQRAVVHNALNGVSFILGILLIGIFFDSWLERLLGKTSFDRRQVGLAGAGLTVALKDFIVGFLGWFVLMGKNGIRLGDWVEINGVTGEVVELGMFHTVLLETGNWTDSGHPTGRRVTFTNSYAIEGHYFNFSTSGQWMWDELQVVLPAGHDPYPIIDAIQKKVTEATTETAKQAEQEWQHAASSRQMTALSAAPAINVRPVIGGVEIAVRYITRANERYQLRAKLYQAAVDLLGQKSPPPVNKQA